MEETLEVLVTDNFAFVGRVLKTIGFDINPDLFYNLRSREFLESEKCSQWFARHDINFPKVEELNIQPT